MKKLCLLVLPGLASIVLLVSGAATGISMGQDAYPVGDATASPSTACIGQTVNLSGSGVPAGAQVTVRAEMQTELRLIGFKATGTADTDGYFSITTVVPSTINNLCPAGATACTTELLITSTREGVYDLVTLVSGSDDFSVNPGALTITGCPGGKRLPETGIGNPGLGRQVAVLLVGAGAGTAALCVYRRRRRLKNGR